MFLAALDPHCGGPEAELAECNGRCCPLRPPGWCYRQALTGSDVVQTCWAARKLPAPTVGFRFHSRLSQAARWCCVQCCTCASALPSRGPPGWGRSPAPDDSGCCCCCCGHCPRPLGRTARCHHSTYAAWTEILAAGRTPPPRLLLENRWHTSGPADLAHWGNPQKMYAAENIRT